MATTVGTENTADKLIRNCILLEHDAIAAYETLIERLSSTEIRSMIESFREDHLSHLDALKSAAAEHGVEPPTEDDMKEMLTTGKVKLADMVDGDATMLRAMITNEHDTASAYSHASENPDLPEGMRALVEGALSDEKRHRDWMEQHSTSG